MRRPRQPLYSGEAQQPCTKIDSQIQAAQNVQPQQSIDACGRRQSMTEHGKAQPLLAERANTLENDARRELNTAARSDLDAFRSQRRIVTNRYKGYQRQPLSEWLRYPAPAGERRCRLAPKFPSLRRSSPSADRKRNSERYLSAFSIVPVYRMANRLERISIARR